MSKPFDAATKEPLERHPVVLLRSEADGPRLTGLLQHRLPDGLLYHEFRYNVVKVWERPVEEILTGNLATLPLAPISHVPTGELPRVIDLMDGRIEREASPAERPDLWAATFLLMGLIYPDGLARAFLQGESLMRDSSTYQAILREGRAEGKAEEAQRMLLLFGREHLGPPAPEFELRVESMIDVEQIEKLSKRLLGVSSWKELLDES